MAGEQRQTDPILRRFAKAKARREAFNPLLQDCYDYAMPNFDPSGTATEGEKKATMVYDSTAVRSLAKRTARMHGQLFPPGEEFLDFDLGDFDLEELDEPTQKKAQDILSRATRAVHTAIDASNFHIEIDPAISDVLISTGAILFNEGTPEEPFVFEQIPIAQIVPEEGPKGTIETVYRPRKVAVRDLDVLWPDAKLDAETQKKAVEDPDSLIDILEAQVHDPKKGDYQYVVFVMAGEKRIVERRYKTKPIICFRLFKVGGEVMGRGPVTLARADIKTANKVVELVLKNATIAVTGIWQADDDGVLNPANIKLVPGTIIPKAVGSSGLTPLESPGRFDVSQLVLAELRAAIRETIEGPPRPGYDQDRPVAYAFMSAERDLAEVEVPSNLRFFFEFDRPFALRAIDILSGEKFKGTRYYVPLFEAGNVRLAPKPASPLAKIRQQSQLTDTHQAILAAGAISPDLVAKLVNLPRYLRRFLLAHGLATTDLTSEDDMAKQQAEAARMQQAHAAGMQQGVEVGTAIGAGDLPGALEVVQKTMGGGAMANG